MFTEWSCKCHREVTGSSKTFKCLAETTSLGVGGEWNEAQHDTSCRFQEQYRLVWMTKSTIMMATSRDDHHLYCLLEIDPLKGNGLINSALTMGSFFSSYISPNQSFINKIQQYIIILKLKRQVWRKKFPSREGLNNLDEWLQYTLGNTAHLWWIIHSHEIPSGDTGSSFSYLSYSMANSLTNSPLTQTGLFHNF